MGDSGITPGTILQDTYRVVRRVGEGGMGEVFEATHARLSGRYAIKLLRKETAANPESFTRFRREAEITSALRHPNIVQVVDFNQTPSGEPYLVMEFLEGADLAARIERGGPLPLDEVVAIVEQVASALAASHSQGVVHRDMKPQNIFLVPVVGHSRPLAKVVDFGISKVRASTMNLTRDAVLVGTPQYMAPEQALGQTAEVDARADQFALAAIAYEMITGRGAFSGENLPAVLFQVVYGEPAMQPSGGLRLPAGVDAVILKGLAKKKDARYPGVLELSRALAAAARKVPPPLTPGELAPTISSSPGVVKALPAVTESRGSPPSTFQAGTGEVLDRDRSLRPRLPWKSIGMGAGAAALLATAAAVISARSPTKPPAAPPAAVVPAAQAPLGAASPPKTAPVPSAPRETTVVVDVMDAPPGVRASLDGKPTTLPLKLARSEVSHVLHLEAPGYQSRDLSFRPTADFKLKAEMRIASPPARPRRSEKPKVVSRPDAPTSKTTAPPSPAPASVAGHARPPEPADSPPPPPAPAPDRATPKRGQPGTGKKGTVLDVL